MRRFIKSLLLLAAICSATQYASAAAHRVELYVGGSVPEWNISNYANGANGFQGQYWYGSPQSLGDSTFGNYYTITSLRHDPAIWNNSFFNTGVLLYWNLGQVPRGLRIRRAYFGLSATNPATEFGNHPTGQDRVPIRRILNPKHYTKIWTGAYTRPGTTGSDEYDWNGASFLNWKQEPTGALDANGNPVYATAPWSDYPSQSPVPSTRTGDATSALGPLSESPRISFNPDGTSMSYSDDVTTIVQQMIAGNLENWGFMTDSWNAGSEQWFGSSGSPNQKYNVRVGIMTQFAANPTVRPRLVLEYDDADQSGDGSTPSVTPTPTPSATETPLPTATPTPTPTPDPNATPTPTPTPMPGPGDPGVQIIKANGGEILARGKTYNLQWATQNIPANSYVWIRLFKNGEYIKTLSSGTKNDGSFNWTIASSTEYGSDYTIKISWLSDTSVAAQSNGNFAIQVSESIPLIQMPNAAGPEWNEYQ